MPDPGPNRPASPIPIRPAGPAAHGAPRPARPPARIRRRLRQTGLAASFLALVALPTLGSALYLWFRAADQYAATAGFAVQSAKPVPSIDLLGGISRLSGASDTQSAMVHEYLQSPGLVAALDRKLDLRKRFSAPHSRDPVFALAPGASREDLVAYWPRMARTTYDSGTGLITLQVRAFTPADARDIARAAFVAASRMINGVSAAAQQDTTRAARSELGRAETRLRKARAALRSFRERARLIDPTADATGQMGLINALQDSLAQALIDRDLLAATTRAGDPRLAEAGRRITATRRRIAAERRSFGSAEGEGATLAGLTGTFERLSAERAFAEKAYEAALASLDSAEAAARQQALYLAAWQSRRCPRRRNTRADGSLPASRRFSAS